MIEYMSDRSTAAAIQLGSHGVANLMKRISPNVVEAVRLDLIQKIGNALRHQLLAEKEIAELSQIETEAVNAPEEWGAW